MGKFFIDGNFRYYGPYDTIDDARKKAIQLYLKGKYESHVVLQITGTTNGYGNGYGYVMDERDQGGGFLWFNDRRYYSIDRRTGKLKR